jgi:hypothetical protein
MNSAPEAGTSPTNFGGTATGGDSIRKQSRVGGAKPIFPMLPIQRDFSALFV